MRDYTAWPKETTEQEQRDGQNASYERWIGQRVAKIAIAEYDQAWKGHHGHELTTRLSVRRLANESAYRLEVS
jgi:hypothetical protein